jgi:hypothetical protein
MTPLPYEAFLVMDKAHWSQFVGLRMLRVLFSRYCFVNSLIDWEPEPAKPSEDCECPKSPSAYS